MVMYNYNKSTKAVTLNNLPEEAWTILKGDESDAVPMDIVKSVPFLYRAIDVRAKAISSFPRELLRNGEPIDEGAEPVFPNLNALLYQVETALCIYGEAYLFKERNLVDLLGVRWLAPSSITPKFDPSAGLTHFERRLKGQDTQRLELDEVVYFWQPVVETDIGPGWPPALVAMQIAGILDSTSMFAKAFFDRGAVFPILLSVDGNPAKNELQRLEAWWKRLLNGVKDAWETIAIKANVKPEIIGPPIDDMAMPELTSIQREDIGTAIGVPHSIVMSNAANYATAQQDAINFYDLTVGPETILISEALNEQLFIDIGLELKFRPERLDVYQNRNLEVGQRLGDLVNAGILTKDEARETLGYEPLEEDEAEPAQPPPFVMQLPTQPDDAMRHIHLEQWERKSLNRLKAGKSASVGFNSDKLSYAETEQILHELALCFSPAEVKAVFSERNQSYIK